MSVAASIYREKLGNNAETTSGQELIEILKPMIGEFDWRNNGPLKGLGGEGGVKRAFALIMKATVPQKP